MSEKNKTKKIPQTVGDFCCGEVFLFACCVTIFLLSILIRSSYDIGSDTAFYLDVARKISNGGHYFYDFFESNFPLSFYFYALQYRLSALSGIHPIILAEIVINLLALLSILWSARILKKSSVADDKAFYNLIIIAFFLGFFLRASALRVLEFGTKTSLLLILLYPYFSFSFARKTAFTTAELIQRGLLMGLIPCLKPHYSVFVLFLEGRNFWLRFLEVNWRKIPAKENLKKFVEIFTKFLFEADKLLMMFIGSLYIFLMVKFTPEFFEFMVPMWMKFYPAYHGAGQFFDEAIGLLGSRIMPFVFVLLIFARRKISANDAVILLFLAASFVLVMLENIGSIDQMAVFYGAITICCFKVSLDLVRSNLLLPSKHKFIIASVMILPIFEMDLLPDFIFYAGGMVNLWWLVAAIYPLLLAKKLDSAQRKALFTPLKISCFVVVYFAMLAAAILSLRYCNELVHIVVNLSMLFLVLFFFEKKINSRLSGSLSTLTVFVVVSAFSVMTYRYVGSIRSLLTTECCYVTPNKLSDQIAYYFKRYAPRPQDAVLVSSDLINHQFPLLNYFGKKNSQRPALNFLVDDRDFPMPVMFAGDDGESMFNSLYFFEDFKNQMANPDTKILIFSNKPDVDDPTLCRVSNLEFYLRDPEFRKNFLSNFSFVGHAVIYDKTDYSPETMRLVKKIDKKTEQDAFDLLESSPQKIIRDYEIYARSDNKPIGCEAFRLLFPNQFCQKKLP